MVFPFKCKDFDLLERREGDTDRQFTEVKTITHGYMEWKEQKKEMKWKGGIFWTWEMMQKTKCMIDSSY